VAVDWDTIVSGLESALNAALDNPSPNYSINGQQVSFADYIRMLREQLAEAEKAASSAADGPYQIRKRAY